MLAEFAGHLTVYLVTGYTDMRKSIDGLAAIVQFNKDGIPVYTEYYPNGLADTYIGCCGYIYQCSKAENMSDLTNINGAYVCTDTIGVDKCIKLNDVYINLLEYEKDGKLIICRFKELSDKQRTNIANQIGI